MIYLWMIFKKITKQFLPVLEHIKVLVSVLMEKTLKINFWRPGDEYMEHEMELKYGVPGEVDYQWVYR